MRVFMLGWEFPPYISGGLGTACLGLTKSLSAIGTQVTFVLPKPVDPRSSSYVTLRGPRAPRTGETRGNGSALAASNANSAATSSAVASAAAAGGVGAAGADSAMSMHDFDEATETPSIPRVHFKTVPTWIRDPYQSPTNQPKPGAPGAHANLGAVGTTDPGLRPISILNGNHSTPAIPDAELPGQHAPSTPLHHYGGDLMTEAQRYARFCVELARGESFDVIHAHDWLTFPSGLAVAAATGKPLIVHVHSTEFDRSGENVNQQVYDIERRGMHGAIRVVCVSRFTADIVRDRYGIDPAKIDVVYNGVENGQIMGAGVGRAAIRKGDKVVLFLGRITMQKGPEYFIRAARKVLDKFDRVKFVVAGSGDMAESVVQLAAEQGIGQKVLFTGFLRGKDVERIFKMADLYVMPSVSEPFGIAPLEAISHDVPVIISKTSGVSEVLKHALKVDFWDVEEMANKIIAVLRHPPLSATLREHADLEVRQLSWDGAAKKCVQVYEKAMAAMPA